MSYRTHRHGATHQSHRTALAPAAPPPRHAVAVDGAGGGLRGRGGGAAADVTGRRHGAFVPPITTAGGHTMATGDRWPRCWRPRPSRTSPSPRVPATRRSVDTLGCFQSPGRGGMGVHYIDADLMDATVDVTKPEALVYELDAAGRSPAWSPTSTSCRSRRGRPGGHRCCSAWLPPAPDAAAVGAAHVAVEGQPGRRLRGLEPGRPAVPGRRADLRHRHAGARRDGRARPGSPGASNAAGRGVRPRYHPAVRLLERDGELAVLTATCAGRATVEAAWCS